MSDAPWRLVFPDTEAPTVVPRRSGTPAREWGQRLFALTSAAMLSANLVTTGAIAATVQQDAGPALRFWTTPILSEMVGAKSVNLRVGPHRFRIPRAYFRHPPHPSGVDDGFCIRALWPGMEPETEQTRAAFRASIRTAEGQRVLQILLILNQPGMPWPVARWML